MSEFSVTSAFSAGFRLIGRSPLAPLAWGALTALAVLPVQWAQLQFAWPGLLRSYGQMVEASRTGAVLPAAVVQPSPGIMLLPLIALPLTLLIWSMVGAAAVRGVLTPDDRRFFYLRIGKRELWLVLVLLTQAILFYVALILMMLGGAVVAGFIIAGAALTHSPPVIAIGAVVGIAAGIAAALAILWLAMRFSLAGPMTVHDAEFRLFESWGATRGYGWKLVGLAVLILVSLMAFEILFFGAATAVGLAAGMGNLDRLQSLLARPEDWLGTAMPAILLGLALFMIVGGYFSALMIAPFADAYRQIAMPRKPEEAF